MTTTDTDEELQDPAAWDWEHAESRPGRKSPQQESTTTAAGPVYVEIPDTWLHCAICGIASNRLDYAHNTCTQDCARTAAIVETINGWQKFITRGMATPYVAMGPVDHSRDVVLDAE